MLAADRDITFIASYHHLLAISIGFTRLVQAKNHTCLAATKADCFQLNQLIRPGEQILTAGAMDRLRGMLGTNVLQQVRFRVKQPCRRREPYS